MKIDVGPQARVVGTKKVSGQGTVAGLREFAGQDVLIVVPSRTPRFSSTGADMLVRARQEARKQGRVALREFQSFRQRHLRTRVPGTQELLRLAPATAQPAIRRAEAWVRASALKLEKRAGRLLRN